MRCIVMLALYSEQTVHLFWQIVELKDATGLFRMKANFSVASSFWLFLTPLHKLYSILELELEMSIYTWNVADFYFFRPLPSLEKLYLDLLTPPFFRTKIWPLKWYNPVSM